MNLKGQGVVKMFDLVLQVAFFLLIFLAGYFDMIKGRIPDWLTVSCMVAGLALSISGGYTISRGMLGLLTGVCFVIIPFAMGWMTSGDVKLMGAIGALMGPAFVFHCFVFSAVCGVLLFMVYTLNGGVVKRGLIAIGMHSSSFDFSLNQYDREYHHKNAYPYAVAIFFGSTIAFLFVNSLGYSIFEIL